jgi:hypothetical protein
MGIKQNVFASNTERKNYYKLCRTWGEKYPIYHNLPFLNVFDTSNLIELTGEGKSQRWRLTEIDMSRLKKTSIDYTLCDEKDRPILCIEFGGLQQGVNIGTEYYTDYLPYPDPWRQEILELKLKVAYNSSFPYFVIGSEFFKDLSSDIKITIIDGIIGSILTTKVMTAKHKQGFDPKDMGYSQDQFDSLDRDLQFELLQDWSLFVETQIELENEPLLRKRCELEIEEDIRDFSVEWVTFPDVDHITALPERWEAIKNALRHGALVTIETPDFGTVRAVSWLPNFKSTSFADTTVNENIAFILAVEKLKRMRHHN